MAASIRRLDKVQDADPATNPRVHSARAAEVRERRSARHSVRVDSAAAGANSEDYNSPITAS
jgi:hypothetical protein